MSTQRLLSFIALILITTTAHADVKFSVTYDDAFGDSFTGRVYIMTTHSDREARFGPNWFGPTPFFSIDVKDWKPDEPLILDNDALGFPGRPSEIPAGRYSVQAVMRQNRETPNIGGPGNPYSQSTAITVVDGDDDQVFTMHITEVDSPLPFAEDVARIERRMGRPGALSKRVRLAEMRSHLLSAFHGRDIRVRATVILPEGYDPDSDRTYPAYYWIGGFGSDHRSGLRMVGMWDATGCGDRIVRIVLDPQCYGGHHVFADSANNGPVGTALVDEFIPFLESQYPLASRASARVISGHSSGGWSSLWLQVEYPETFGAVWSLAPDPIDFRDFQQINLYAPNANMYVDEQGERRPLARQGQRTMVWYDDFAKMEVPLGEGGQLRSFEWTFSGISDDGLPMPLYDRETGAVDPTVADSWKPYDIRRKVEENWDELGPRLDGKLHIIGGEFDTFFLEGAVELMGEALERLGADAEVRIVPGTDHGSFATPKLRKTIDEDVIRVFESGRNE